MEFRLLLPADARDRSSAVYDTAASSPPVHMITVEGRDWMLSEPLDIEHDSLPEYVCISYKWGSGRQDHALFPDKVMSTHAIPSLATVIRSQNHRTAFWTDVFCVPPDESTTRQATLENLGYIYARAAEVVVVLGAETYQVMQDVIQLQLVSEQSLRVLESDLWIASVWTYQELVNASAIRFMSEQYRHLDDTDDSSTGAQASAAADIIQPPIDISQLLDALGHGLVNYRQMQDANVFATINEFPNLNVLENTLVDWMVGAYTRYSALTIFSNIYYKRNSLAANYYYAILGALSDSPHQLTWPASEASEPLAEKTMRICEAKSDFSFIYCVAERDADPNRRWRPRATTLPPDGASVPPMLRPILVWHYWGEAQSGTLNANNNLTLHNMSIMRRVVPLVISDTVRTALAKWSSSLDLPADDTALVSQVYSWIRGIGFEGEPDAIAVPDGLVFTVQSTDRDEAVDEDVDVLVSHEIRFSQGAPGLVRHRDSTGEKRYSPCVFVGLIDRLLEPGVSVLL